MWPDGPVRQPYFYTVPSPHRFLKNSNTARNFVIFIHALICIRTCVKSGKQFYISAVSVCILFIFHIKKDGSGCKVIYEDFLIYEEIGKYLAFFSSLLIIGGSFAKNLLLLLLLNHLPPDITSGQGLNGFQNYFHFTVLFTLYKIW